MNRVEVTLINGLTIGPAQPEEMDAVCEIAKVAWEPIHVSMVSMIGQDIHDAITGDWRDKKASQIRRQYRENPNGVLAIRDSETVAGFVTFGIDPDRSLGTIYNNAVSTAYQGKGIATAMYRHVLGLFQEAGLKYASVTTGLDPGHAPARKAYEKAGFDLRREDVTYYKRLNGVS